MIYAEAMKTADGFVGRAYKYDATGNHVILVQKMRDIKLTENEALDDIAEWLEEKELEFQISF